MTKIEYNLTSYEDMARYFAKCLKLKLTDNVVHFTPEKGSGYIKVLSLLNGLQLLVYDCTIKDSILFHRKRSDKEFFVLRLDEVTESAGETKASVFFAKTNQEWFYMMTENCNIRQVSILISKTWLQEFLENESGGEQLSNYISLKSPLLLYEMMDREYRRLFHEILSNTTGRQFESMIMQNRVSLIMERFFTRLHKSIENETGTPRISAAELKRIKDAEGLLLKDFSQKPPSIAQLSRIAAMSPSKLKILFKEVYGMPINQYYQRHRMNKAKAMMLSKKYTIREIASLLGFNSVTSLNKSLVRTFEQAPAELSAAAAK